MVRDWKLMGSRRLNDYGFFSVRADQVRSPRTQETHEFYVLETGAWVNVIALTPTNKVVTISQFRHGIRATGMEIPGGIVEAGEQPCTAAERELAEETGYAAAEFVCLGRVAPNPALQDNWCYSYLAVDAKREKDQSLDPGEDIAAAEVDLERIPQLIRDGTISHGLVIVAFHLLQLYRQES
jgi:ADP-ribose pyrophosphatase